MIEQLNRWTAAPCDDSYPRLAAAFSAAVHAALFALAGALEPPHASSNRRPAAVTQVELEMLVKESTTVVPVATPVEPVRASSPPRRSRPAPRPAPAAPAPAAAVFVADPRAAATDTVVSGTAETSTGGATAVEGTAPEPPAVAAPAPTSARAVNGVNDGPDRSRAPRLSGATEWRCPFPIEADSADIDRAVVMLRVEVARDGSVIRTAALDDPGHGFGRQAQRCALRKRWAPGLDRSGKPAPATAVVRVRFER